MSFNFIDAITEEFEDKKLGKEVDYFGFHSTGNAVLDLFLGGRDPETGIVHPGIPYGKMITIVGPSSSGKTTLALKIAFSIIEPFGGRGAIIHDDFERATERSRVKTISGLTDAELKSIYTHVNNEDLFTENVYNQAEAIAELKTKHMDKLIVEYPHPLYGDEVMYRTIAPTVILIDSQAAMVSRKIMDTDGMEQNNMAGSQQASLNAQMYNRLNTLLRAFNIIPIVINHVTTKVKTGMFPDKPIVPFLKPDENLPGGVKSIYLSDTLLKVTGGPKLEKEKEYGIKGSRNDIQIIKSRSNEAGKTFKSIFNFSQGFSNALTIYEFLKANKLITGAGRSFKLSNLPDVKFSQKQFEELFETSEDVQQAVYELLYSDEIVNQIVPDVSFEDKGDFLTEE